MDDFYAARSSTKPPLPWTNFPPPFSLRMATRIALEEGVEIQGRDDAMQAIIEDECHKLRAVNQRQPSDSSQDNFHNGLF